MRPIRKQPTFFKYGHMAREHIYHMCGSFEACITGADIKVGVENVPGGGMHKGRVCVGADEDYFEFCHL